MIELYYTSRNTAALGRGRVLRECVAQQPVAKLHRYTLQAAANKWNTADAEVSID